MWEADIAAAGDNSEDEVSSNASTAASLNDFVEVFRARALVCVGF